MQPAPSRCFWSCCGTNAPIGNSGSRTFGFKDGPIPQSISGNLKAMEVHFTPDDQVQFLAALGRGIAAAERRDFIEADEMDARVERMFRP